MSKYYVKSGSLQVCLLADSPRDAAIQAVRRFNPDSLGLLIQIDERGYEIKIDTIFFSIIHLLHDEGIPCDFTNEDLDNYYTELGENE